MNGNNFFLPFCSSVIYRKWFVCHSIYIEFWLALCRKQNEEIETGNWWEMRRDEKWNGNEEREGIKKLRLKAITRLSLISVSNELPCCLAKSNPIRAGYLGQAYVIERSSRRVMRTGKCEKNNIRPHQSCRTIHSFDYPEWRRPSPYQWIWSNIQRYTGRLDRLAAI